jgi:hypothetical protein
MPASPSDEIAAAAARLVVEEGMEYGAAKRKAARAIGRGAQGAELPSNEAVEDEVRAHIELFHADTQPAELAALREVARGWMERLAAFRPHLTGAVWRGTATRLNNVQLELFCDDPKEAEIALINLGVPYDSGSLASPRGRDIPVLSVSSPSRALGEPVTVHLTLLDHDDLRGALRADARGQTWRGNLGALRALMGRE